MSKKKKKRIGWECPVCHKGNAPKTEKCLHCAEQLNWSIPQWTPDPDSEPFKITYTEPFPFVTISSNMASD